MANQNGYKVADIKYYENTFDGGVGIKDPSGASLARKTKKGLAKEVSIAKGVKVPTEIKKKMNLKAGGSNVGKYKKIKVKDFAGPAGGAPRGSFPINTKKRAKAALSYARNAPNPAGIKRKVYDKFPSLKK